MGKEILIATTTSDSLCEAWELQSQWTSQLTLKVPTVMQTLRWHFTHPDLNTQVSQLNVIVTSLSCQVVVNAILIFFHVYSDVCINSRVNSTWSVHFILVQQFDYVTGHFEFLFRRGGQGSELNNNLFVLFVKFYWWTFGKHWSRHKTSCNNNNTNNSPNNNNNNTPSET